MNDRGKRPCWLCKLTRDMVERLERGVAGRLDGGTELIAEVREGAAICEACGRNPWGDAEAQSLSGTQPKGGHHEAG